MTLDQALSLIRFYEERCRLLREEVIKLNKAIIKRNRTVLGLRKGRQRHAQDCYCPKCLGC